MGRDMVTAARLITCVGDDGQAVSQRSERTQDSPLAARLGRRRGKKKRGEGGKREKTKESASDAARAPPLHRETPQARVPY